MPSKIVDLAEGAEILDCLKSRICEETPSLDPDWIQIEGSERHGCCQLQMSSPGRQVQGNTLTCYLNDEPGRNWVLGVQEWVHKRLEYPEGHRLVEVDSDGFQFVSLDDVELEEVFKLALAVAAEFAL